MWCGQCRKDAPPAPRRCYKCHRFDGSGRTCATCRRKKSRLYSVQAATGYEGYAKRLVWKLKFDGARAAAEVAADLMCVRCSIPAGAIIVPVPTATGRVRQRGYDQARLLARLLAIRTQTPEAPVLIRLGQRQQHGASRAQRLAQLQGAFRAVRPGQIRRAHIVLVDDVITTGATLEEAARVLRAAGAKRVSAVVFAQA